MEKEIKMDELEQMRSQMGELRGILKEQHIINEKIMRRTMGTDYGKVRKQIWGVIIAGIAVIPFMWLVMPIYGSPMWFVGVTVAFLLLCVVVSFWSLRRYASCDLLTDNLTEVAGKIVAYKQMGNRWLCFSIPVLVCWLCFFFYFASQNAPEEYRNGIIAGGIGGIVVGAVCGIIYNKGQKKQLNGILEQINEVKENSKEDIG